MDTIGFVSTYSPTRCGIATFNASLMAAISDLRSCSTKCIRLVGSPPINGATASEVVATIQEGDPSSIARAIQVLNGMDFAIVQHEFGIYGGNDGDEVLTLLRGLRIPSIVVLHTVLSSPSPHQKYIVDEMCRLASAVVVMSETAHNRLASLDSGSPRKFFIVPHGARQIPIKTGQPKEIRPLLLTWGLIGPGKGIEWAIEAVGLLRDLAPAPLYIVAGRTHPKVLQHEGESYRVGLQRRIYELGLNEVVVLKSGYLEDSKLDELIASSSVVILPYDTVDQVTSGVLIEAVTAGRPIVATNFPHAIELLGDGAGIVVPHRDPAAIAAGVRNILLHPDLAEEMTRRMSAMANESAWPSVAAQYMRIVSLLPKHRVSA